MVPHDAAVETELLRDHMALVEFLAHNATAEGMPRAPGRIVLTTRGVAWVAEVQDPDAMAHFRVAGLTLDGVLTVVQELLASGQPPWETVKARR